MKRIKVNQPTKKNVVQSTCLYCYGWQRGQVIKHMKDEENKPVVLKAGAVVRVCALTGLKITSSSKSCKEFSAGSTFYCEHNVIWLYPANCEHRRKHNRCPKNCKQFQDEMKGYIAAATKSERIKVEEKPERIKVEEKLERIKVEEKVKRIKP